MGERTKDFKIGQVVYVLSNKTQAIVPALIIEETVINTLSKKDVSWKVAIGPQGPKQKIIQASDLNGELFPSLEAVQTHLQERLNGFIKKVVGDAKKNENNWYGTMKPKSSGTPKQQQPLPPPVPEKKAKLDPEAILSEFDDSIADIAPELAEGFQQNLESYTVEEKSTDLRKKLRAQIAPSAEELKADVEMIPDHIPVHTFDLKV